VPLVNIANGLTVFRLVLVPIFVWLVIVSGMTSTPWRIAACVAFIVASATDIFDGFVARRWQLVTSFGKVADPIADKALTGSGFVLLSAYGELPWWVTVVVLVRELAVTLLRFWVIRHGVIAASRGGKLKTILQSAAIGWYIMPFPEPVSKVGPWLMVAAVAVTIGSAVDYAITALRMRRDAAGAAR
jgi:CDP-diacylglycerol---glycerol-3-phosphate 3-phosphatidyltransferase